MTGTEMSEATIRSISDWLVNLALEDTRLDDSFRQFCERLASAGFQLLRGHMALRAVHPLFTSITTTWTPAGALDVRRLAYGSDFNTEWQQSPLFAMIEGRQFETRHRLDQPGDWARYPMLKHWAGAGATDYVAILTPFGEPSTAFDRLDGVVCSWMTDRPGGFSDSDIAILQRLQPRLGVAAKVVKREQTALAVAAAYLGKDAGRRVLDGQIRRGDSERIQAVLWYADMRNSTTLAEQLEPESFLAILDAYFECTAGAILEHGGEVLSFIGDAVFGVFPFSCDSSAGEAADAALKASLEASRRVRATNVDRTVRGEPAIHFGLGLHIGEVLYGNIGVPERLEFSVIGRAANTVARIEALTKTLDKPLLASAAFADLAQADWSSCGRHTMRGIADEMEIYSLNGSQGQA